MLRYLFWLSKLNNLFFRCDWSLSNKWCRQGYRSYCGYPKRSKCRVKCYWDYPKYGWNGNWKDGKITCPKNYIRYNPWYWYNSKAGYLKPEGLQKHQICQAFRRMSSVTCRGY